MENIYNIPYKTPNKIPNKISWQPNLKNGTSYKEEELKERGVNISHTHVDFMFGSCDMEVTGLTHDGKVVQVFKDGNFVF